MRCSVPVENRQTRPRVIEEATKICGRRFAGLRQAFMAISGPVRVGAILWPNALALAWYWRGTRYNRTVHRVISPAGKRWLVCPTCGWWRYNLYVYPPGELGCRECLGLTYGQWYGRLQEPKTAGPWSRWLLRRAERHGRKKAASGRAHL